MMFKSAFVSMALLATAINAAVTSTDVVRFLEDLAKQSKDTNALASGIAPTTVFTAAPKTLNGYKEIITTGSQFIQAQAGTVPFTDAEDIERICSSYKAFTTSHERLLNTVVAKHDLLQQTYFAPPFGAALRGDEQVFDAVTVAVLDLAPSCASGKAAGRALSARFSKAIEVFT